MCPAVSFEIMDVLPAAGTNKSPFRSDRPDVTTPTQGRRILLHRLLEKTTGLPPSTASVALGPCDSSLQTVHKVVPETGLRPGQW